MSKKLTYRDLYEIVPKMHRLIHLGPEMVVNLNAIYKKLLKLENIAKWSGEYTSYRKRAEELGKIYAELDDDGNVKFKARKDDDGNIENYIVIRDADLAELEIKLKELNDEYGAIIDEQSDRQDKFIGLLNDEVNIEFTYFNVPDETRLEEGDYELLKKIGMV